MQLREPSGMNSVLPVAAFCGLGLWLLFNRWRTGRTGPQFVLGIFPAALLFMTVPVPFAVRELILGFQRIGQQGDAGVGAVAPFCLVITRTSRLGAAGFLVAMGTAGALQVFAMRAGHRSQRTAQESDSRAASWRKAIAVTSTLLAVPVALLSHVTNEIPRVIMRVSVPGGLAPGETVQALSERIAGQSVFAVLLGILLTAVIGALAVANIVAARSGTTLESLTRYAWALLVVVSVWAIWDVAQLTVDINAFQLAVR
jgi:hypothetical protein